MKDTYNTGKVRIGLAYEPRRRIDMSSTDLMLQRGLIGYGKPMPRTWSADALLWIVAAIAATAAIYLFTR